jgi:hypothetical protein
MGKKTAGRHPAKPAFRESDFAGMTAQDQANLSGSLNQLSLQLAATRKLLQDIEGAVPHIDTPENEPQAPSSGEDAVTRG